MCGRFALFSDADTITRVFRTSNSLRIQPHYNIAPSQSIATIVALPDGNHCLDMMRWGFKPGWMKDKKHTGFINARFETAATKPAFRHAFKHRRCLILTNGFYEWQKTNGTKQPYFIFANGMQPFAFAGIWEKSTDEQGHQYDSCAILTMAADHFMQDIHERMPAVVNPSHYDEWLADNTLSNEQAQHMFISYTANFHKQPISTYVNSPEHDDEKCIQSYKE